LSSVQVLLAVHNGARHLEVLIRSLKAQVEIDELSLLASDDHSTDGSKKILRNFGITTLDGPTKGAATNFRFLITNAGRHDFYAFADQDDVWFPNKMTVAISKLKQIKGPAIYVGSTIDTKGKIRTPEIYTLPESLMTNQIQGCTIVINNKFLHLIQENLPKSFIMHDWWIYNFAQCFGQIVVDETPSVIYRLHGLNLIGTDSRLLKISRLLRKLKTRDYFAEVFNQAQSLVWSPSRNTNTQKVESWLYAVQGNLFARIKYLYKSNLNFHSIQKKIFFSFLILAGKYRQSQLHLEQL